MPLAGGSCKRTAERLFRLDSVTMPPQPSGWPRRAIAAGRLWLWDDDGPASLVMVRAPAAGVSRLGLRRSHPQTFSTRSTGCARAIWSKSSSWVTTGKPRATAVAAINVSVRRTER